LDRVLMRSGERGEDERAAVGMPLGHRKLVAVLDRPADLVDIGEIDLWIDALREEVEPKRDEADIARAPAVAEQRALHPVGAGQYGELGRRDAGATVVMRVDR